MVRILIYLMGSGDEVWSHADCKEVSEHGQRQTENPLLMAVSHLLRLELQTRLAEGWVSTMVPLGDAENVVR